MATPQPAGVLLNGDDYPLKRYRKWSEAAIIRQPGIVGSDRPQKDARPHVLTYKADNWSKGEGVDVLDSSDEIHLKSYSSSDKPPDISVPGKVSLGRAIANSRAAASSTNLSGPHLAMVGGNPWLLYEGIAEERTTSPDTWTVRTETFARAKGYTVLGNKVYVGDHNAPISRVSSSASVDFTNENGHSPLANSGRLYSWNFNSGTGTFTLYQYDLSAATPVTGTSVGTYAGNFAALSSISNGAAYGTNMFWIARDDGDEAKLLIYDGKALTERKTFPRGFSIVDTSGINHCLAILNDFVWATGYYAGTTDQLAVLWVSPDLTSGTLVRSGAASGFRSTTSMRGTSVNAVRDNQLLIGTNIGKVFLYDMGQGSFSLFADVGSPWQVYDAVYANGYYYLASRNTSTNQIRVDRTDVYVSDCTITQPLWDFDYPYQSKILTDLEIQTEALPAGTSVTVTISNDTGTDITTDVSSNTLIHNTLGATTKTFTLNATVKWVQVKIKLATSNTANTPTLLSVTLFARSRTLVNYHELEIPIGDDRASRRRPDSQLHGGQVISQLDALTSAGVFSFTPYWGGSPDPAPGPTGTARNVTISQNPGHGQPYLLDLDDQGHGLAKIILEETANV